MDWLHFFDTRGIEYQTKGPSVTKGNIAIHCPWCGADDPSHHLSVNLEGRGWRCWRRPLDHRGRSAARLIQALLNCSPDQAQQLSGNTAYIPDDFMSRVQNQLQPPPPPKAPRLLLPKEFKPIQQLPSARPFIQYLRGRGFTTDDIWALRQRHGIRYCTQGPYKGRIIFPIKYQGELVTWTGRTIYPIENLRYKTLSADQEKAEREGLSPAVGPLPNYLLWFDQLTSSDADTIYLSEGPFDALKIRTLGRDYGICATCFFTAAPTETQINLLHELLPRFKHRYLLLDQGTLPTAIRIASLLTGLGVGIQQLPKGVKDPGLLTKEQLLNLS